MADGWEEEEDCLMTVRDRGIVLVLAVITADRCGRRLRARAHGGGAAHGAARAETKPITIFACLRARAHAAQRLPSPLPPAALQQTLKKLQDCLVLAAAAKHGGLC